MRYSKGARRALSDHPRIVAVLPRPSHIPSQLLARRKPLRYEDTELADYRRIDGRRTALVYVVDKAAQEVVMVVKVVLFKDMTPEQRSDYGFLFDYIRADERYRIPVSSNAAMVEGTMKCAGYRAAYEAGYDYGQYTMYNLEKLKKDPDLRAKYLRHAAKAKDVHRLMSEGLYSLSPILLEERALEAQRKGIPLFGDPDNRLSDQSPAINETTPFTPHIIYTFNGFVNVPHCDNDSNLWATGVWGPCSTKGGLMSMAEGFHQSGHAFYNASYGVLVDIATIDGVVEMAWRGRQDIHGTTTGVVGAGCQRFAFTAQLNKRLDQRVTAALTKGYAIVNDDMERLGMVDKRSRREIQLE